MFDFRRLFPLAFLAAFACSCSRTVQLKEGDSFETPGFYGIVDEEENGIWVSAKDGSSSAMLLDEGAALILEDAWFSVKHEKGKYQGHVFTRTRDGEVLREEKSGK